MNSSGGISPRSGCCQRTSVGRLAHVVDVFEQDRELVAAQPGDSVAGAQVRFEPPRDAHQKLVADHVPERVVDHLEAVEVEEEQRERPSGPPPGALDGELEVIHEEGAVGQPRQRVVQRAVDELLLGPLAVRDVLNLEDEVRRALRRVADERDAQTRPDRPARPVQEASSRSGTSAMARPRVRLREKPSAAARRAGRPPCRPQPPHVKCYPTSRQTGHRTKARPPHEPRPPATPSAAGR
jgi:hypothetical protein